MSEVISRKDSGVELHAFSAPFSNIFYEGVYDNCAIKVFVGFIMQVRKLKECQGCHN